MEEVLAVVDTAGDDLFLRIEEAAGALPGLPASSGLPCARNNTRAYLKIQDGCDGQCSYCIVPAVRGKPVSRPFADVVAHAKQLIDAGVPELVFTGITIGKYSDNERDLSDLAEAVLSLDGDFRLRITSIEPRHVTEKFLALFGHPRLCDHIHLPLQSGSNAVLARMNRPYTREEYLAVVRAFRKKIPDIAIGADVIVGYPGETDEDFSHTLDMVREAAFSYVHQFSYSPRGGTPSAAEKACDHSIVASRASGLKALASGNAAAYAARFDGKILNSVVEKGGEHGFTALTSNYLKVELDADAADCRGRILPVRVDCSGPVRRGEIIRT
jgi:threonylcarbamoyladenosine tRNA methylthiotransferase MtaB